MGIEQDIVLGIGAGLAFISLGRIAITNIYSRFFSDVEKNQTYPPLAAKPGNKKNCPYVYFDHRPRTQTQVIHQQFSRQRPLKRPLNRNRR